MRLPKFEHVQPSSREEASRRLSENRLTAYFSKKSLEVLQNIPRI